MPGRRLPLTATWTGVLQGFNLKVTESTVVELGEDGGGGGGESVAVFVLHVTDMQSSETWHSMACPDMAWTML